MRFTLSTKGFCDVIDITDKIEKIVQESGAKEGLVLIFSQGSTCGITMIEYEKGIIEDFKEIIEKIIPQHKNYKHCQRWGDCNGFSHLRSALIPPSLVVPIENGNLVCGTWQQIVFIDFDNRSREREVVVKVMIKH